MKQFESWAEKYRASGFLEFKGQNTAVQEVKSFFQTFNSESTVKKALLLHGPTGVGKTSLAYAVKNELDLEIFELNASDFRNKEQLQLKLKPASEQKSLFKKSKVILVDEVDGLSTYGDHGGLIELCSLIEDTKFPIIITANDIWDQKFNALRSKCKLIPLKDLDYKTISLILQEIAKKENLNLDNQIIVSIAIRSKGDVRAAINDLQVISSDHNPLAEYNFADERNKEVEIFDAIKFVFKNMLSEETTKIYDSVNMPLDKIFLWIEENIPYEYKGEELYKAYEALSLADVFRGRVMRQRYWRFLVYQNIFLSAGIALSKTKPKIGYTHYQKPTRILKIWMSNNKNAQKKTIVAKYAEAIHCSKKKAQKEFSLIVPVLKNPNIQKELKLSEQEIEYLNELS
jgi:replication factor C large subunit